MVDTIEVLTAKYVKDTYGKRKHELTDYDRKFINSLQKFQISYANELSKRRCTVFLKEPLSYSIFEEPAATKKTESKSKSKTTAAATAEVGTDAICKAIKISDNKQCTRKAKAGCDFCGHHKPK